MATYDIVEIGDYVSVQVKGALSVADFQQLTDETLAVCQQKGIRKVVTDVMDTAGSFTPEDVLEFSRYASDKMRNEIDQYAYVYPKEYLNYSAQVISQGSGFNVRGFYSMDDALTWIDSNT